MSVLPEALQRCTAARTYYDQHKVYERHPLSPIWVKNIATHFDPLLAVLTGAEDPADVLAFLHDKAFFDTSVGHPQMPHALAWYERLLERHGWPVSSWPREMAESLLFSKDRCMAKNGRRLSTDFLWRCAIVRRLSKSLRFTAGKAPTMTVVELGSGCGNFARALKVSTPAKITHVCIDLPESLFFAHLFLTANFPEARVRYVSSKDEVIERLGIYDFVFVPTEFAGVLAGHPVDLFVNMNSLGEMPNAAIEEWIRFVEDRLRPKWLFLLNRFLNRCHADEAHYRKNESSCSLALGTGWKILDWEVDPEFERSPYLSTLLTRNLLVVAERATPAQAIAKHLFEMPDKEALSHQDWLTQPGWSDYKLSYGRDYPPVNCRADLNMTMDLTRTGALFQLWDRFRLYREAPMLYHWMERHSGNDRFEEALFLEKFL